MKGSKKTVCQTRITFSYTESAKSSSKILSQLDQIIWESKHIIYQTATPCFKFEMIVEGKIECKGDLTPILKKIFGKYWQAVYKFVTIQCEVFDNIDNIHGGIKTKSSLRTIYTPMRG